MNTPDNQPQDEELKDQSEEGAPGDQSADFARLARKARHLKMMVQMRQRRVPSRLNEPIYGDLLYGPFAVSGNARAQVIALLKMRISAYKGGKEFLEALGQKKLDRKSRPQ